MTVRELIKLLQDRPNLDARVVVYGTLNYPFQHAPIQHVTDENGNNSVYLNIKK